MILKSLKQKSKSFIFKSFGNYESDEPAKIIFSRFPMPDEQFPAGNQKSVLDSGAFKNLDDSQESKESLVDNIIENMVSNIMSNRTDYKRFFTECVERIEDLVYESAQIKTAEDFFKYLPEEASFAIAQEAYGYAREADRFTADYKKK